MAVNIKEVKKELLTLAGKKEPPADFVKQDDIMDMMLKEYFNPASRAPKEMTLNALVAGTSMSYGSEDSPSEVTEAQVKAVLDKFKP